MSSSIYSGKSYIYVSNARFATLIEAAVDIGRELAKTETEKASVLEFERWWKQDSWTGIDIELGEHFRTMEECKLWCQVFETLAWRVFERAWGNQKDRSWQVDFIAECHIISTMFLELIWKEERGWYPERGDEEGIRPNSMRIQE